jgi:serine protease
VDEGVRGVRFYEVLMTISNRAGAALAAIAGAAFWFATVAAQNGAPTAGRRAIVAELAAPGIDRGLRNDVRPATTAVETIVRGAAGDVSYLRGSVIVKFRAGTTAAAQQAMLTAIDGRATADLSYADFDIVSLRQDADPEAIARRLQSQPDVEYAQPRYRVRPAFVPNDPLYREQWHYPALDMERAWDINPGATSTVTVAVLDSGLAYRSIVLRFQTFPTLIQLTEDTPPVLFPSLGTIDVPFAPAPDLGAADRFVSPRDFIWDDTTPVDMDGHGTHVAGILGQLTNNNVGVAGMAFNVRLMPVKVIDGFWDAYFGSPFFGTDDVVARGVRYAVDNGADVLNMSIGRSGPPAPVVQEAIAYAVSRGAFVAIAGGNDFQRGNPPERLAEFAPQIDGMVAVGAIGRDRARAAYSSTGPYLELAAPGGDASRGGFTSAILQQTYDLDFVETFFDGPARMRAPRFDIFAYERFQGTSMAVPHVSGLAAMLIQQGITSPAAIEAAMKRYATDLGPSGRDDEYGYGLINPRASLRGMGLVR